MRRFRIVMALFLLLFAHFSYGNIIYESFSDAADDLSDNYTDNYDEGTRYSSGYGYEQDWNRGYYNRGYDDGYYEQPRKRVKPKRTREYGGRMASQISGHGEKVIIIDPRVHAWGAYDASGNLLRSGTATAGSGWCKDVRRPCRTRSGTFRIYSLGDSSCYSRKYPLGRGGAPMPYCMYFNGSQGIHGSYEVANANLSHGCVRVRVPDARWIRYNFAGIGTKVVVRPY